MDNAKRPIFIEGYLTQGKLDYILGRLPVKFIGAEVNVPGTRRRWDFMIEHKGEIQVIEFDGDAHYRDALIIRGDREKDKIAVELGYKAVRIPYWVQLTTETLAHFTGIEAEIHQSFPHGFVDKKAVLPASYCEKGIQRFKEELKSLPTDVTRTVIQTLKEKDLRIDYVIPSALLGMYGLPD